MPKVSQEHLERRRQQIIDAARECFTKQGFYNTSMQDIFKASGLSAGAVYRYFPSKHQLVKAIAEESLDIAMARLPLAGDAPHSMADIVAVLSGAFTTDGALAGIRPIVMQVWAEAPRDPEMAAIAQEVLGRLEERIQGVLPPGSPPEVAGLLMATVQGFMVQSLVFGDITTEQVATAARAAFR
jgi:TetR/AcrR family transcriptional regulator, transcriptional repressor of aconitase